MHEQEKKRIIPKLFEKEQNIMDKINNELRIVTGGKK